MASLEGWAVPLSSIPILGRLADHTYVKSSEGHVWKCHGASNGGNSIVSGTGDADFADCMSQPNSDAGIIYSVTGVCHQMANRILEPANVLVKDADGYGVSSYWFGHWGLSLEPADRLAHPQAHDFHERRQHCGQTVGGVPFVPYVMPVRGPGPVDYDAAMKSLHLPADEHGSPPRDDPQELLSQETLLTVASHFGENFDPLKRKAIVDGRLEATEKQKNLARSVLRGDIGGREYAETFNALVKETLAKSANVLARDEFRQYFGCDPGKISALLDLDATEAYFSEPSSPET